MEPLQNPSELDAGNHTIPIQTIWEASNNQTMVSGSGVTATPSPHLTPYHRAAGGGGGRGRSDQPRQIDHQVESPKRRLPCNAINAEAAHSLVGTLSLFGKGAAHNKMLIRELSERAVPVNRHNSHSPPQSPICHMAYSSRSRLYLSAAATGMQGCGKCRRAPKQPEGEMNTTRKMNTSDQMFKMIK